VKSNSQVVSNIGVDLMSRNICALDLGTTKFCLAKAIDSTKKDNNIHISSIPADGMHRGMLRNKDRVVETLQKLIENHENRYHEDIRKVVVGIAGSHLRSHKVTVTKKIKKSTISYSDLIELKKLTLFQVNSSSREPLDIVPINYAIDSRIVEQPVGSHGRVLTCESFVVDADKSYLKDVIDVCNRCGLVITEFHSEQLASASAILTDNLKSIGCVIIDIGGGTSDGIVFINNSPQSVFTVNIGGKMMTKDLSIGLGISIRAAERIKNHLQQDQEEYSVNDIFDREKKITKADCFQILIPRIYELASLVNKEIAPIKRLLPGGIILTGGASQSANITRIFEEICKIPTRCIMPVFCQQRNADVATNYSENFPASLSTVLGLLKMHMVTDNFSKNMQSSKWSTRVIRPIINWIKELY